MRLADHREPILHAQSIDDVGEFLIVTTTAADGSATITTSGGAEVAVSGYPAGAIIGLRFGAQYGSAPGVNGQLDGEIADYMFYNRVLSPTERANAIAALKSRYGIA